MAENANEIRAELSSGPAHDLQSARKCLQDAIRAIDYGNPRKALVCATAAKGYLGDFYDPKR